MVKNQDVQFVLRIWKGTEKRKKQNIFDLPERGTELKIFSNFPVQNLNFHERCG